MNIYSILTTSLFLSLSIFSCKTQRLGQPTPPPDYNQQIEQWQHDRRASLSEPNGWLSLVGLHWLEEGENKCGSGQDNQVILPRTAPQYVGSYTLNNGNVHCSIKEQEGLSNTSDDNCNMAYEALSWKLIERGGRYGIRIRDSLRPARIRLRAIEFFDIDPNQRVFATWTAAAERDSVLMRNVLDMEYAIPIEGQLTFKLKDKDCTLTALDGGKDELFLIFSDDTTGELTYGGGRYLSCPRPNDKGITIIDFNKSYNPPCAFTEYATCLLPRPENHLPLELLVGEKAYGEHH